MYVVCYCQIYAFHPSLNLGKIVIIRSFQQSEDEIYDLSHFRQEHVFFFDKTTFFQLKDAATGDLVHEKAPSLAELLSAELKFTIDTLNNWFSNMIEPKFLKLSHIKKKHFIEKKPTYTWNYLSCLWVSSGC